ncbi:hypothetical protein O0I10_001452 [Lichtheimia ornata]|uniref:GST C-terminal domain-containing protein n=1 Tax=Lichtheimia ornata TaxID=688661 RepID=A0AAD7VCV3_9FUNG|nr:uncharacterized protein O0I10_001452 [Lichtheimia ornata]KAJ8662492.1 hypothetical protein O0I10_001452 [Lichtheimia ornata]
MTDSIAVSLYYILPEYGGLGGPIRLMLDDAGVFYVFNYIEYYEEFPNKVKPRWIEEGHPFDCAPMIELYEKRYSGTQPILRFLSKKLNNKYTPDDLDLEQYVDATTDYAADWIQAYFNAAYRTLNVKEYQQNDLKRYLERFDRIYSVHEGPYAAGQKISYCDFFVYIVLMVDAHKEYIKDYPYLVALAKAIESRPNLQNVVKQL